MEEDVLNIGCCVKDYVLGFFFASAELQVQSKDEHWIFSCSGQPLKRGRKETPVALQPTTLAIFSKLIKYLVYLYK